MNNISIIGKRCSGCRACSQSCGVKAISFHEDSEGFMQPVVDETLCVECGKCLQACPVNTVTVFDYPKTGYAAKAKDLEDLRKGSSGGLFYAMAKIIIQAGGVVCGCGNDENLMPKHYVATTLEEAKKMRGSKYVQSDMNDIFTQVKYYLKNGVKVLFTGVPCQVAGLRNYLGKDYPNLYCIDIICHGVPSGKLYSSYLQWLEKKWGGKVTKIEFRSKKRHEWSLTLNVHTKKDNCGEKEHLMIGSLDPFYHNFLQGNTYRESCYTCPYSQEKRVGDVTIGDFWGVENTHPELFDIHGLSCALVNSNRGHELWNMISQEIEFEEVKPSDIINYNGNLREPTKRSGVRDKIYKIVEEKGFDAIPYDISARSRIIDSIKNVIPNRIRYAVKKIIRGK